MPLGAVRASVPGKEPIMIRFPRWAVGAALIATSSLLAPAASAAIADNSGTIEVFAGWYMPEDNVAGQNLDDWTGGIRGGVNFTPHFLFQGGVQVFQTDYATIPGDVNIDQWMADLSFGWMATPDKRATFLIYGGPGYVWTNFDFPTVKDMNDDNWSAHVGIGGILQAGKRFYIRPDVRFRWIDGNGAGNDSRNDWEGTVGFGWLLGDTAE